jgi:poly-gamma-glutamate capsule biosynthesis protein CapA/YwtB (metallophosphatase superfamily)
MIVLPLILCSLCLSSGAGTMGQPPDTSARITVTLRFAGDVLLASHYETEMWDSSGATFRNLYRLGGADATVVNLESPITTRGARVSKPYNFRMNPRFLGALKGAGIDIVIIANNHIYDYGPRGLLDTISYLDSVGVRHVGAGRTIKEAHTPVIDTLGGRRIAFLAYYGGGEAPGAGKNSPGVARRDLAQVCADIGTLRSEYDSCYIVIILHWGTERATRPDGAQVAFAHALIDSGADAVVGHHPHVLQGIERYRGGVIAYSLGNFVFGGNDRGSYDTGLFEIRLGAYGARCAFIPVRIDRWRAAKLTGADSLRSIDSMRRLSSGFHRSIFTNQE